MRVIRHSVGLQCSAVFACTLIACTLSSLPARAQVTGPAAPPVRAAEGSTGQGIRMDVALALVNVTVTDPYNRLVTGLDKDNFHVFEDGVPAGSRQLFE